MQFSLNIIMTKEILRNLNFNQEKNTKYKIFEMLQIQDKYNTNKTGKSKESMKDIMEDHEVDKNKNEIQDSLIKLYANMDIQRCQMFMIQNLLDDVTDLGAI